MGWCPLLLLTLLVLQTGTERRGQHRLQPPIEPTPAHP